MECSPLTLLCGLNGMGKSSIIQSLLILKQSIDQERSKVPSKFVLSGPYADLGTSKDVFFEGATTDTGLFELNAEGKEAYSFEFKRLESHPFFEITWKQETVERVTEWQEIPPVGGMLHYVSAERIGPRNINSLVRNDTIHIDLGSRNEQSLAHLHSRIEENSVLSDDDPRAADIDSKFLEAVVNYWLDAISPGAHLQLTPIEDADALLVRFYFDTPGDVKTKDYRAINVGFGLSYTLPVIISLLSPEGTLCLIENPEAHLHPSGQTKLAKLAVAAAKAGVQVLIETHSDHFMDGVRIAVHDGEISPDQVAIHYFERNQGKSVITTPKLDRDGRLSFWPTGFFDQHEENLIKLLDQRK